MVGKDVLVTGVAGFIGSKVAAQLVEDGYVVTGVDDLSTGSADNVPQDVNFVLGDVSSPETLSSLHGNWAGILHFAGQSSGELSFMDPVDDLRRNTLSTIYCAQLAARHRSRFLFASSMAVYSGEAEAPYREFDEKKPSSFYGLSKLSSEGYVRLIAPAGTSTAMRMFSVYGPGQNLGPSKQGMVRIFLSQAAKERKILVRGSPGRVRDFIHIDDVVKIWTSLLRLEAPLPPAINVGTGVPSTVAQLVGLIAVEFGGTPIEYGEATPGDQSAVYADNSLLERTLGKLDFKSLSQGIRETVVSLNSR